MNNKKMPLWLGLLGGLVCQLALAAPITIKYYVVNNSDAAYKVQCAAVNDGNIVVPINLTTLSPKQALTLACKATVQNSNQVASFKIQFENASLPSNAATILQWWRVKKSGYEQDVATPSNTIMTTTTCQDGDQAIAKNCTTLNRIKTTHVSSMQPTQTVITTISG